MDLQVKSESLLGNGVVDTKTYLPLVAVKNGQVIHLFSDGYIDLTNVPLLRFPNARYSFIVKMYRKVNSKLIESDPYLCYLMEAGRTSLELAETFTAYIEATIIVKENQ